VGWRGCAGPQRFANKLKGKYMLYTIAVILLILWLLGLVSGYAIGGLIHILLVIALVMVLVNFISGRRGRA
jgi:uncharacterized membrane protein